MEEYWRWPVMVLSMVMNNGSAMMVQMCSVVAKAVLEGSLEVQPPRG